MREGTAHAALVFDGRDCVGWCQFGSPDELPRIKRQRAYLDGLEGLPDWRITCFFVDKAYRGQGVAAAALAGALQEIARLGGGTVESYPEEVVDRSVSGSFLHNGTLSMFERQGFERGRQLGKNHWVVAKVVSAKRKQASTCVTIRRSATKTLEGGASHGYGYRATSSRASGTPGKDLQGIPRRRRHGQMAAAERLHRQGPPPGGQGWRDLQDVVHELHVGQQPLVRRRIPRARAERAHSPHGQVRRPESAGRQCRSPSP